MSRGSLRGLIESRARGRGRGRANEKNHLNLIRPENTLKYLGRQRNLHNIPHKIRTIQGPMRVKCIIQTINKNENKKKKKKRKKSAC